MKRLTKEQFSAVVACVQEDLEAYVDLAKRAFTKKGKVEELQFDDVVYVNQCLVNFLLDKNYERLVQMLMHQDTFVREQFLSAYKYLEEEGISVYY